MQTLSPGSKTNKSEEVTSNGEDEDASDIDVSEDGDGNPEEKGKSDVEEDWGLWD